MAAKGMKAVQYSGYGGGPASLKHVTIPVPVPKKGEMLVKIEAASVNPFDWKINKGIVRPFLPRKFPHIPGTDIAGEVVSVGASVTDYAPGDKVVSWLDVKTGGSFAEYTVCAPKDSAKLPRDHEVSAIDGASLPVAGMSALQCLSKSGVSIDGSYTGNVLITGATGGVGLYCIQLAKLSGAHVTVTAGKRNIELAKELGADEVLDYKTEEGSKLISPSGKKYDVVVNCANIKWATILPHLSATGHVQELNPSNGAKVTAVFQKITWGKQKRSNYFMIANHADLAFLVDLVAEGMLKTVVDSKYPLDKAEDAWTRSKDGHSTAKIVVTMVDE